MLKIFDSAVLDAKPEFCAPFFSPALFERTRPPEIHYAPKEPLDRLDAVMIATAKTSIDLAS